MLAKTSNTADKSVFMSNTISDHEMSFEIKNTLSIISGSNWEYRRHIDLKHIELKHNVPVCL